MANEAAHKAPAGTRPTCGVIRHAGAVWPWLTLCFMFLVGLGTGNFSGYGPIFSEIFPTKVRNTAMGAAFNLARGVQFFTPLIITGGAARYGLGGGISLASLFAIFTGAWV